jgi:hypothetical protein
MHILNAVSPGFTCAIPFAEYVCEKISRIKQSVFEFRFVVAEAGKRGPCLEREE